MSDNGDDRLSSDDLIHKAKERLDHAEPGPESESDQGQSGIEASDIEPGHDVSDAEETSDEDAIPYDVFIARQEFAEKHPQDDSIPSDPVASPLLSDTYSFQSARTLARLAQVLIGLVGIATIFGIWATFGQIDLLQRIQDGDNVSFAEAAASDNLVATAAQFYFLAFIPSLVVYLVWLSRSVRNLGQVRSGDPSYPLQFTPGWAVGWHFVPFMNLFRPFQAMRELYQESNPAKRGSPLVGWWWGVWLAGGIVGPGLSGLFSEPSLSEMIQVSYRSIASDVLIVIDAVLIVGLINQIMSWQESRAEQLGLI